MIIFDSSFNIDLRWLYLGVFVDGIVDCRCCGIGVSGIKCLYMYKDFIIVEVIGWNNFSLKKDEFGKVYFDKSCVYYY